MSGAKRPKFLGSKSPEAQGIKARASTITNAFAHAVLPVKLSTIDTLYAALDVLGQDLNDLRCVYCGALTHGWDHLRPTVARKLPTGYITEVFNQVPACGKCNSSKGGKDWKAWMLGNAKNSPTRRGVDDIPGKVARLEAYEAWAKPTRIDFETLLEPEEWRAYWRAHDALQVEMVRCQKMADALRAKLQAALAADNELGR